MDVEETTWLLARRNQNRKLVALRWLMKKLQLVAGKKTFHMTVGSFMKLLATISPLIPSKANWPGYRLLSCKHFKIDWWVWHRSILKRACEVVVFMFLKINKGFASWIEFRIRQNIESSFHPGLEKITIIRKIWNSHVGLDKPSRNFYM